jgi:hypothetical protein
MLLTLNTETGSGFQNKFTGRLPYRMGEMQYLKLLRVNLATLSGPLPEFTASKNLGECSLEFADYCLEWTPPVVSSCDFSIIPMCNADCMVLYDWIEYSPGNCCSSPGISCSLDGRIEEM